LNEFGLASKEFGEWNFATITFRHVPKELLNLVDYISPTIDCSSSEAICKSKKSIWYRVFLVGGSARVQHDIEYRCFEWREY